MKKFDKIIIVSVVVVAIILGIIFKLNKNSNATEKYAEIYVKGKLYKTIELKKDYKEKITIDTELGKNIVSIENGGVRIIEADCPDKICVKDGFKDQDGDILVCLPHKVVVKVKGGDKPQTDDVVY